MTNNGRITVFKVLNSILTPSNSLGCVKKGEANVKYIINSLDSARQHGYQAAVSC